MLNNKMNTKVNDDMMANVAPYHVTVIEKETAELDGQINYTGELVTVEFDGGFAQTYRVIKHSFTPFGFMRDCGKYYEVAHFSCHSRIDKDTLVVLWDVDEHGQVIGK